MLFSSPVFILFFLPYFFFHLFLPAKFRLLLIIAGSLIFYGYWNPFYLWLPLVLICIAYAGALGMHRAVSEPQKKARFISTLIVLFLPLIFFKYTNFFYNAWRSAWSMPEEPLMSVTLPLGISFITFTLVAYLIDVRRQKFQVERRWDELAGSVLFFPHLIAGPIVRPSQLIPQLCHPRPAMNAKFLRGVFIFSWGLVKKLVFADTVAAVVNPIFSQTIPVTGTNAALAIYGYAVQIYCDFSGYSDMALGLALVLGIRLPINFDRPYFSKSLAEFWRKWHMTLSFWLRDYLYIPLGGNRGSSFKKIRNILVTMALGGLWHGANWTFVIWGIIHGVGIALSHAISFGNSKSKLSKALGIFFTFHFVALAWVFFRAKNLTVALQLLCAPFTGTWSDFADVLNHQIFAISLIGLFFLMHTWDSQSRLRLLVLKLPKPAILAAIFIFWVLSITLSAGKSAEFIYFDF